MDFQDILFEKAGNIGKITINRQPKLNAMTERTRNELADAVNTVGHDRSIRCLILTGAGDRAFSSGQDLEESKNFSSAKAKEWVHQWDRLYLRIIGLPQPVVTSTPGYAVGAGWQVYLLGDYRVSSNNGKFAMTEIDAGIPCITGSAILRSLIGLSQLTRITMMCDELDANEANRLGLVHKIVPAAELESATLEAARKLAVKPPIAVRLQREWFKKLLLEDLRKGVRQAKLSHAKAFASGEPQECMRAFLEKRAPRV
jgi:enoyl-CoA hydratase